MRFSVLCFVSLTLAACAHNDPKPAICDGKHRRPANPYGSVLPIIPDGGVARSSVGAQRATPTLGPQSALDPRSAHDGRSTFDLRSFAPCGARA